MSSRGDQAAHVQIKHPVIQFKCTLMMNSCLLAELAWIFRRTHAASIKKIQNNRQKASSRYCTIYKSMQSNRSEQWRLDVHAAFVVHSRGSKAERDKESPATLQRFRFDSILMQRHTKEVLVLPPPPKSISTTFALLFDRNMTSKTTFFLFQGLFIMVFFFHLATFPPPALTPFCFHNKFDLVSFLAARAIVPGKGAPQRLSHVAAEVHRASCV